MLIFEHMTNEQCSASVLQNE